MFILTRKCYNPEPIEPLNKYNAYEYLNPECYNICKSFGGEFYDGYCYFKKSLTNIQVGQFVQMIGDSIDTKLYFATRKNGSIWSVVKSIC